MGFLAKVFPFFAPVRKEHEVITKTDPATGTVTYEAWYKNGKSDRADGPAVIERDAKTGTVTYEAWYKNGKLHRADGPALIVRDAKTGIVTGELWRKDGRQISPSSAAVTPAPAPKP